MWVAQLIELADHPQKQDEQREQGGKLANTDGVVRGYRILEELRAFPSVAYLERIRSTAM